MTHPDPRTSSSTYGNFHLFWFFIKVIPCYYSLDMIFHWLEQYVTNNVSNSKQETIFPCIWDMVTVAYQWILDLGWLCTQRVLSETLLYCIYNTGNKGSNSQSYSVSPGTHNDQIDTFGKKFSLGLIQSKNYLDDYNYRLHLPLWQLAVLMLMPSITATATLMLMDITLMFHLVLAQVWTLLLRDWTL